MALVCLGLACLTSHNVLSMVPFPSLSSTILLWTPHIFNPFLMNILGPLYVHAFAVGHLQYHECVLGSQQLAGKEVCSEGYVYSPG